MPTHFTNFKRRGVRNLKSAGMSGARFAGRATAKSVEGLFRWATTDHSGMSAALNNMPKMGFIDTIKYISLCFCFTVAYAIVMGITVFLTIAFWIPFLLGVIFG